jgi:hypothetical protein
MFVFSQIFNLKNMILTHSKDFLREKMALVCQILEFKKEMAKYLQEVPGQNI